MCVCVCVCVCVSVCVCVCLCVCVRASTVSFFLLCLSVGRAVTSPADQSLTGPRSMLDDG